MQYFQDDNKFERADDMVGRIQSYTASVGMHQGNVRDIPEDAQQWISNPPGWIHQQEAELLREKSEVQESQNSFGRGKRVKKSLSKGKEYKLCQVNC